MSSGKRKKSAAWAHFTETSSPQKMKCCYCQRICSISCGSTGNLIRHLRMRHPKVVIDKSLNENPYNNNGMNYNISTQDQDIQNETVQTIFGMDYNTSTSTPKPNQEPTSNQPVQYYIVETVDENKFKEINKQLLRMIVKGFHPFAIVENPEFRKLMSMLNQAYNLPGQKDITTNLLPEVYQATVDELKSTLMEVTAVALTTDRWTSVSNERYITVTAHYLNKNFELKSSFLSYISFPEKHSSNNIAEFLQDVTTEWELSDKVVAVVTDNVPSMVRAVNQCKWQHVSCFAGILNKIVNAGLTEMKPLTEKVRQIIGYFKRNTAAMSRLIEIQNQMGVLSLKMKIDVPARWNSTFEMLARFLKNKKPLQSAINLLELNIVQLSSSDWIVLEEAIRLLIIFNSITVEISAENNLSLSKVPYMVKFVVKHVTSILEQNNLPIEIKNMANIFKEELQKYFKELESNTVIGQSVLLDPRFKKRGFPENSFNNAYASFCSQVISMKTKMINEKIALNESERLKCTIESDYFVDIWCEFKEKDPLPRNNANEAATAEISTFINDEYLSLSDDPITYWANVMNQSKFPTLFKLVKKRLCIPATAVPGQKIFTKQGHTLLDKRSRVISGKLKEILFLNHNL